MTRVKIWLVAAGTFLTLLIGAWFAGQREGFQAAVTRLVRRRVEAMQETNEVRDEVNDMGADERRDALARWMRD